MDNQGLLFIPDISGYTKFINETEIDHSRFIIQELLEVLVNSNSIGLQISEIEGDAILFYRFGKSPDIKAIYQQVENMFCNFHKQLRKYEQRRICPCKACQGAQELSLKVITHHGEFSTYTVKDFSKLIGKDVIRAHQLLKNDIPLHEYWLVTDDLFEPGETTMFPEWFEWQSGSKLAEQDNIGYHYSLLSPLKNALPEDFENEFAIQGERVKMITSQKNFQQSLDEMFGVVVDLTKRSKWLDGIKAVEDISKPIPQIGMAHKCVLEKNTNVMITSAYKNDGETIILEETDKRRMATCQIILEMKGEHETSMTFNFFVKKNILFVSLFNLFMKKKIANSLQRSLENLQAYFKVQKVAA
jgi:hypothetical protein